MEETTTTTDPEADGALRPIARPSSPSYDPIFQSQAASIKNAAFLLPPAKMDTYIVQVPRDQIFSVPPPENAMIAERYRKPDKDNSHRNRLLYVLLILIAFVIIIGALVGILHSDFLHDQPKVPVFSIVHVNVKNKTKPEYDIRVTSRNPNLKIKISYIGNGGATLLSNHHTIGIGKFPVLDQEAASSSNVLLALAGTNGKLPLEVDKSIKDKSGKHPVSLLLKMNVPVKINAAGKVIGVICNFRVSSLGAGKDVSQKCDAKFM